jgi:hypothetical protein
MSTKTIGIKHELPAPSSTTEQEGNEKKQQCIMQQTKLSFVRQSDVKNLIPSLDLFQCIHDLHRNLNGNPIQLCSKMEAEICMLDNCIKNSIMSIHSGDLDYSAMNQIGKEAQKQVELRDKLRIKVQKTKKDIEDVRNARHYAKLAVSYFTEHEKPMLIVRFVELVNKANDLLMKIDAQAANNKKNCKEKDCAREHSVEKDMTMNSKNIDTAEVVDITESEIRQQVIKNAIDKTFNAQQGNDCGRKSLLISKVKSCEQVNIQFAKDGSIKNAVILPIHIRLKYKDRQGSGLFTKADAFKALKEYTENVNWWLWTPVKLEDNTLSSYGELTCKACSGAKMYHLRSVRDHLKTKKHQAALRKKQEALKTKTGCAKILQERVDKIILCR